MQYEGWTAGPAEGRSLEIKSRQEMVEVPRFNVIGSATGELKCNKGHREVEVIQQQGL